MHGLDVTGVRKQPSLLSLHDVVKSFLLNLPAGLTHIIKISLYCNNQCALFTRCQFCMVTSKLPPSTYSSCTSITHALLFCCLSCISHHSFTKLLVCGCLWHSLKGLHGMSSHFYSSTTPHPHPIPFCQSDTQRQSYTHIHTCTHTHHYHHHYHHPNPSILSPVSLPLCLRWAGM